MDRKAKAEKIILLGVDGLDPRLCRKYVDEGKMPNLQKVIERGSCRKDLVLLGGHPTVTPSMWTTLATGAYSNVHGITAFYRRPKPDEADIDAMAYNFNSENCKAEPLWNCFAEAGKKTLVWHWPGSAWPPTSDNPNLMVVDGTVPGSVNIAATIEKEFIYVANKDIPAVTYKPLAAGNVSAACVIEDLQVEDRDVSYVSATLKDKRGLGSMATMPPRVQITTDSLNEGQWGSHKPNIDVVQSPIKPAQGWAEAPDDALEMSILYSQGFLRRPALILKNEDGVYDHVAIYKSKKETTPITVIYNHEFKRDIVDEALQNDEKVLTNRNMTVLDIAEDGSHVRMWISAAMDINGGTFWHPKALFEKIKENVGFAPPTTMIGTQDPDLVTNVMLKNWYHVADWQAQSIKYMIDEENVDVVFSHFHAIDLQAHRFVRYMYDKGQNILSEAEIAKFMEDIYVQTDYYIGQFVEYLDQGAALFVFSDHALICSKYNPPGLGDIVAINAELMKKLGYTVLKKDADGNELKEIDWEKTKAIAWGEQFIYLNLKGRNKHTLSDGTVIDGIVDPADRYELEEQIISDLYSYRHPISNKRVVAIALRNRDAVLLGQGGPEAGDIITWNAEGYNYDHADSLSTALGEANTSVSPMFVAAGPGIKEGYYTDRIIRQIDFAPTVAVEGGVRFPAQCEGAPAYQIFEEEL